VFAGAAAANLGSVSWILNVEAFFSGDCGRTLIAGDYCRLTISPGSNGHLHSLRLPSRRPRALRNVFSIFFPTKLGAGNLDIELLQSVSKLNYIIALFVSSFDDFVRFL
jgi:hypothetical protein